MLGRDRSSYDDLLEPLRSAGYALLALDFRGHGESRQGPPGTDGKPTTLDWESFGAQEWAGTVEDVRAGLDALRRRRGVDPERIGIMGASIGANAAVRAAAQDVGVRGLVLLSPGLDYRGVTTMDAVGALAARPVLIAAAQQDTYSFTSSQQLVEHLPQAEFATLPGDAHGTNMFVTNPELGQKVAAYLQRTIGHGA
jgi:pimeloyl-ACP methyl ester carboxylesterase